MDKQWNVGIADMKLCRNDNALITYALGSCVGIAIYDPALRLGTLTHIMLPKAFDLNCGDVFKYADTGIREALRRMGTFGGNRSRYTAKIAGGAKMFELKGDSTLSNIGLRNVESVKQVLREEGIRLVAEDTGANYARTMLFDVQNGQVFVRTYGRPEIRL